MECKKVIGELTVLLSINACENYHANETADILWA